MENTKTHEQKMKELREEVNIRKQRRAEINRPTVWYNSKLGHIEIHFNNKTILAEVTDIDRETPRDASDEMAKGSGFKQIIYQTEED